MEVARKLVQQAVRGFYEVRSVIVVDALLVHHVLSDKEMTQLLGLPGKDLRAICAKLKDDHLICETTSKEESASKEHRVFAQSYYWIHFTEAVDAIKWKIYSIENRLRTEMDAQHNPQDYVCDTCKARYDTITAAGLFDPDQGVFVCEVCSTPLREDDGPAPEEQTAQDRMGKLMSELKGIITSLRQIDELTVPENTFKSELAQAVPIPHPDTDKDGRDREAEAGNAAGAALAAGADGLRVAQPDRGGQEAVKLQVHIASEAERKAEAQAAALERQRLAQENVLPEWHRSSTVERSFANEARRGEKIQSTEKQEPGSQSSQATTSIKPEASASDAGSNQNAMDEYYKKLAEQQANNGGDDDDDDEDDDDEDEFEDIV